MLFRVSSVRTCHISGFTLAHYENTPIQIYRKFHFQILKVFKYKTFIFSHFCQNVDCGYSLEPPRRGDSNEYQQSMFLSRNKKNNVYPCKPQFYYIKWGLGGSKLYRHIFVMPSQVQIVFKTSCKQTFLQIVRAKACPQICDGIHKLNKIGFLCLYENILCGTHNNCLDEEVLIAVSLVVKMPFLELCNIRIMLTAL